MVAHTINEVDEDYAILNKQQGEISNGNVEPIKFVKYKFVLNRCKY